MTREEYLKLTAILGAGSLLPHNALAALLGPAELTRKQFGKDFVWGTATAAYQIEGAWDTDGKGPSVWDHFTHHHKGKIKTHENGDVACDFYHKYESDIELMHQMNIPASRFSISWSRVLPEGTGAVNQKGIDYYHRVIDKCLKENVEPWITCYHWDLPQALEDKGGWANRDCIKWFEEFVNLITKEYGSKVKNWMVFNEPMAFVPLGYLIGVHAPGYVNFSKFYKAVHHVVMCHGAGGRIIRANVPGAKVGTTFSCSHIDAKNDKPGNIKAAKRADAFINRLFIDPVMGLGYPKADLPACKHIMKHMLPGDEEKMKFDFDFIGLQNYSRMVVYKLGLIPIIHFANVPAKKLGHDLTDMGWEVYPEGIYHLIKKFGAYKNMPQIIITENGAAFPDENTNGEINDVKRLQFIKDYLAQVLKAKQEGVNVGGYFIWSFMDNFEWAEGYRPRFGIVGVDFKTQQRTVKTSGKWFKEFLSK
ncbi:MAG TPA: GH1 family beta-glucosidase [Chitinophagales bacterium]|nr:GH1 family beta-glucosidase [Chitinophagales bacterium]